MDNGNWQEKSTTLLADTVQEFEQSLMEDVASDGFNVVQLAMEIGKNRLFSIETRKRAEAVCAVAEADRVISECLEPREDTDIDTGPWDIGQAPDFDF